jgi:hypothetical protein
MKSKTAPTGLQAIFFAATSPFLGRGDVDGKEILHFIYF